MVPFWPTKQKTASLQIGGGAVVGVGDGVVDGVGEGVGEGVAEGVGEGVGSDVGVGSVPQESGVLVGVGV